MNLQDVLVDTDTSALQFSYDGTNTQLSIDITGDTVANHNITFANTNLFTAFNVGLGDSSALTTQMTTESALLV